LYSKRIVEPDDFDPAQYPPGGKHSFCLEFEARGDRLSLPVLLARGAKPGKRLVATAAVHGDEYEGVRAILDVFEQLDPARMAGDFLAVPVSNPPAFWALSRTSPLDGLNLARVFPGRRDGSPTESIAWRLDRQIIRHADLYIDLHSGGVQFLMPAMAGYWAGDERAREAALAFGAPVVWAHPTVAPGRTISAACARGIPALYTEARGAGRIDSEDLRLFTRGLMNLLRRLAILDGAPEAAPPVTRLYGDGNIDDGLAAAQDGFLIPQAGLLDSVTEGQQLGALVDLLGRTLERYQAPRAGRVALIHACPRVRKGEPVFLITGEDDAHR